MNRLLKCQIIIIQSYFQINCIPFLNWTMHFKIHTFWQPECKRSTMIPLADIRCPIRYHIRWLEHMYTYIHLWWSTNVKSYSDSCYAVQLYRFISIEPTWPSPHYLCKWIVMHCCCSLYTFKIRYLIAMQLYHFCVTQKPIRWYCGVRIQLTEFVIK